MEQTAGKVFKTVSGAELPEVDALNVAAADENGIVADSCYQAKSIHVCSHKLAQRPYSFRSSRERTVSMTVPVHLREQALRLLQKYSVTLMQKTSVDQ